MKTIFIYVSLMILVIILISGCKKDDNEPTSSKVSQGITVFVNSNPAGANIDLDGGVTGKVTPYTFTNLSVGTHRFRIYRNEDYSQLDTSLYLQENDERVITANIKILWRGSWSGSSFVGKYQVDNIIYGNGYWAPPFDTVRVPTTLNARITIYFNDERCTSGGSYLRLGNLSLPLDNSPTVFTTNGDLIPGTRGKLWINYSYGVNCYPQYGLYCCRNGITVTNVVLETF